MSPTGGEPSTGLNQEQCRFLKVTCEHVDQLLQDMEDILATGASRRAFPKYVVDLSPVQRKTIEDHIAQIRAQLVRILSSESIQIPQARIAASHALHTTLTFVEIAIEELHPNRMRGYGALNDAGIASLLGLTQELSSRVQQLHRYVLQKSAPDFRAQLDRLANEQIDVSLLRTLEEIISRRGLVEFRPTLEMLLERLQDNSFEIAIFGRVSSGKSSLLNHLIGEDILPVGVTPITAVPTRIAYGELPEVLVQVEGKSLEHADLIHLPDFVDQQSNPGNRKRVAKLTVRYPSEHLREGTVLVDTPGLGSIETSGAAETMAYLPHSDMGYVLVDAGSSLSVDDLKMMQALSLASVPWSVLLSKADLLSATDLTRVQDYIHDQIRTELGVEVHPRPISVVASRIELLESWFEEEVAVLYEREKRSARESVCRKSESLRDSVRTALEIQLSADSAGYDRERIEVIESDLRAAAAVIPQTASELRDSVDVMSRMSLKILDEAAERASNVCKQQPEIDLGSLLTEAANRVVTGITSTVMQRINQVADALREALTEASDALDPGNVVDITVEREMPMLQLAHEELIVQTPKLAKAFGAQALKAVAKRKLELLRPELEAAIASYAIALRGWTERSLSAVESQFNRYADQYRAQTARILGASGPSNLDVEALKRDIEALAPSMSGASGAVQVRAS